MSDTSEFITKNGLALHLGRAPLPGVRAFLLELGGAAFLTDPANAPDTDAIKQARNGLWTYLLGWGVTDTPSATDAEALRLLNRVGRGPHLLRADWLKLLVLTDDEEGALLFWSLLYGALNGYPDTAPPAGGVADGS